MAKTKAAPANPDLLKLRARAEHAEKQRDDLAVALREILDAHYHWRQHGEGKTGAEADEAAQRFIDARSLAGSALAMAPEATAATAQAVNARILEAARQAYEHVTDHDHDGVTKQDHFFGALMERLGISAAEPA